MEEENEDTIDDKAISSLTESPNHHRNSILCHLSYSMEKEKSQTWYQLYRWEFKVLVWLDAEHTNKKVSTAISVAF